MTTTTIRISRERKELLAKYANTAVLLADSRERIKRNAGVRAAFMSLKE